MFVMEVDDHFQIKSANHTLQNKRGHLSLINNFHLPDTRLGRWRSANFVMLKKPRQILVDRKSLSSLLCLCH